MGQKKEEAGFRPFAGLAGRIKVKPDPPEPAKNHSAQVAQDQAHPQKQFQKIYEKSQRAPLPADESTLFQQAMRDVTPLDRQKQVQSKKKKTKKADPLATRKREEAETLASLNKLVEEGEGFYVAHTPEYMEVISHSS